MNPRVSHRTTCRLCDGSALERVLPLVPTPIADAFVPQDALHVVQEAYPLDLYLCHGCGHVQMLHVVDPSLLFKDYLYVTSSSPALVEHFRGYADHVAEQAPLKPGSFVVEIGSNDGSLLRFFRDKGMRVLGIDPAQSIARQASEAGIETLATFFSLETARQIRSAYPMARLVLANNVFAHVDDLAGLTEGVRTIMAEDGLFVFEVSYLVDIIEKMLFDTVYHEHLCYHSVKPLDTFFRRHGLELIDVMSIPTKGGSIRCTVQHRGGPRPVAPAVAGFIAREDGMHLDQTEPYRRFAHRIAQTKEDLLRRVHALVQEGKTVAGYGASHTVTTLLYQFDLGHLLQFLADDNPRKHHLYSPGHHIPVFPSEVLYEKKPDYVIILAWNYAQPIIARHQGFIDQGGRFIIPLPQVRMHPE
jgi:SAM-dependent methyltransferase